MELLHFYMTIQSRVGSMYVLDIARGLHHARIVFSPETRFFAYLDNNSVSQLLQVNEMQFLKLLTNKRPFSYYPGFQLYFSLWHKKDTAAYLNKDLPVVLDRRRGQWESYQLNAPSLAPLTEVYTDGSYLQDEGKGGFAVVVKPPNGLLQLHWGQTTQTGNNQMELLAAIQALQVTKGQEQIRLLSDSRYVVKGLTEWVVNWKANNWYTANGTRVKHRARWQLFDKLSANRYIEFQWVKGHAGHEENRLCDFYAREAARR